MSRRQELWRVNAGEVSGGDVRAERPIGRAVPTHAGASVYESDRQESGSEMDPKYAVDTIAFGRRRHDHRRDRTNGLCTFFAFDKADAEYSEIPFGKTGLQLVDAAFTGERLEDRVMRDEGERSSVVDAAGAVSIDRRSPREDHRDRGRAEASPCSPPGCRR